MSNPMESNISKTTTDTNSFLEGKEVRMENVNDFGILLFEARKVLDKKKSEASKELGVTADTLYKWENGEIFPDEGRLGLIAKVYDIELDKLTKVFKISQQARNLEREARFSHREKGRPSEHGDVYLSTGNGSYQRGKIRR